MFDKDFYPTPKEVIELMGFDCAHKVVLEPSAGSGNIVDYLNENNARDVLTCESNEKLASIIKPKSTFINDDFLNVTREEVSHINMIIANPPFSRGVEHILHMWEIAPDGCEIYTLINHDNLSADRYNQKVRKLNELINLHGGVVNLGACFDNAERKTNVQVGLIKLFRPPSEESGFEGFFMDDEHQVNTQSGLIKPDKVRDLVERYVDALKEFKEFEEVQKRMNHILKPVGVKPLSCTIYDTGRDNKLQYDGFVSALQRKMWTHVFNLMNLDKYLTSKVREKISKFSEQQKKVPFTMKNIYRMVEIIEGTSGELLKEALVNCVDNFTEYTAENRYHVEGWKTNKGHLLGKKFISEGVDMVWTRGISWGSRLERNLNDLIKVLCNLTATNVDSILKPTDWVKGDMETGTWYDVTAKVLNGKNEKGEDVFTLQPIFFEYKFFKKGSIHIKFKDHELWALLNRKYAEIKGATLPEKL